MVARFNAFYTVKKYQGEKLSRLCLRAWRSSSVWPEESGHLGFCGQEALCAKRCEEDFPLHVLHMKVRRRSLSSIYQ